MITNHLLKHLSVDIDHSLYTEDVESDEAMKETVKLEFEAKQSFDSLFQEDRAFHSYYKSLKDNEEKAIIKLFAELHFFTIVMDQTQRDKKLQAQLNLCESFLESDICHRDTILKERVQKERLKLKKALEGANIVDTCIRAMNSFYKKKYPHIGKTARAVKISTALHYLKIFKDEPFMDITEADDYAQNTGQKSGQAVIYGRLKAYIT